MINTIYDIKILTILIWTTAFLINFATTPIHSALYLIFTFILSALLLFNLGFILISYMYIIIYVGAIAILFLFIVMLLNLQDNDLLKNKEFFWYKFHIISLFFIYYSFFKIILIEYYVSTKNFSLHLNNNFSNLLTFNFNKIFFDDLYSSTIRGLELNTLAIDINKILGFYLYNENGVLILILGMLLFISIILAIFLVKPIKK